MLRPASSLPAGMNDLRQFSGREKAWRLTVTIRPRVCAVARPPGPGR